MNKLSALLLICLSLTACESPTQTTSGEEYLSKYQNVPLKPAAKSDDKTVGQVSIDEQIRQVASVEPILTFPARIGIARIDRGSLSNIPAEEMDAWLKLKEKLGDGFGEFIPVNPAVANMVSNSTAIELGTQSVDTMTKIRLGAARQHLDAVMIYEVYSKSSHDRNFLAIGDITLIGSYILPSRRVQAEGYASAMLIDVIQGYPYAQLDAVLDKEEAYTTTEDRNSRGQELEEVVKTKAVTKLADEAEKVINRLRLELAEKRAQK